MAIELDKLNEVIPLGEETPLIIVNRLRPEISELYESDRSKLSPEDVPMERLRATQRWLDPDNLETLEGEEIFDPILALKYEDLYYIVDGHHRAYILKTRGEEAIASLVYIPTAEEISNIRIPVQASIGDNMKSKLFKRRASRKLAITIEPDWDTQTRRDTSREENRMADKVLRDVSTYVQQLKQKLVVNDKSLGQALSVVPIKDLFTSQDYTDRTLGNRLRTEIMNFINGKLDPKEKAFFKEQYGNNITKLLEDQVKVSSLEEPIEAGVLDAEYWVCGKPDFVHGDDTFNEFEDSLFENLSVDMEPSIGLDEEAWANINEAFDISMTHNHGELYLGPLKDKTKAGELANWLKSLPGFEEDGKSAITEIHVSPTNALPPEFLEDWKEEQSESEEF